MLASSTTLNLEIEYIKNRLNNQDKNMEVVFQYLDELMKRKMTFSLKETASVTK